MTTELLKTGPTAPADMTGERDVLDGPPHDEAPHPALDHHVDRLADDHANAARLAEGLAAIGLDVTPPETNLVYVDPRPVGLDASAFAAAMAEHGVEISTLGVRNRLCTHLDVSADDIEEALAAAGRVVG